MGGVFLKILNMSIAASWLILAVVLLRFLLKKAPKWVAVLLWGIVALRLTVPVSFKSALSLIPSAGTFSAYNIQYGQGVTGALTAWKYGQPAISSEIPAVNSAVNPVPGEAFAPNPGAGVNPLYVWTWIASAVWLAGIAAMLLYAAVSYARVRLSVAESAPYEDNIFLCDHVKSPFILGLVRPEIYLPSGISDAFREPVIAHERAHLARHDHWWKSAGFLILAVHWFNPLCWAAYILLCRDIELACDEKVVRRMDLAEKKHYSAALLECSTGRRLVSVCPLAFGEVGVRERVKHVLNYRKPALGVVAAAVAACVMVTVCFATDPDGTGYSEEAVPQEDLPENGDLGVKYPEYLENGTFKGPDGVSAPSIGETASDTENETPAENPDRVSAEEAADIFGIPIVLPKNSNWIADAQYCLVDDNNLRITYHDLIADADCTLSVSKNADLNLPPMDYDEALNETWGGAAAGGQYVTVSVRHERNNGKMTLAVWEYKEYRFAIMGEDDSNVVIPKAALAVIENLD